MLRRPARARLDDAHAVVYGVTPAELAALRARLPPPSPDAGRTVRAIVRPPPTPVSDAVDPASALVEVREVLFERRDFWNDRRQPPGWSEWHPVPLFADPAEAWETLATRGLVPLEWVDAPRRRFQHPRAGGGLYGTTDTRPRPYPWSAAECVAFASDVPGVLAAEAIAAAIVAPLLEVHPPRIAWRVGAPAVVAGPPAQAVTRAQVVRWVWWLQHVWRRDPVSFGATASYYYRGLPAGVAGPPLDRLPELLATGYALDDVADDGVRLVAPPLEKDETPGP